MANALYRNPVYIDSASGGEITGIKYLRLLQWVNDGGDINNTNADLVIVINDVTLTVKIDKHDTDASVDENDVVAWQIGPFSPGIPVDGINVTTIDAGAVHIWLS